MSTIKTTSMSPKGQVVIPASMRKKVDQQKFYESIQAFCGDVLAGAL